MGGLLRYTDSMQNNPESIRLLRHAGEQEDDSLDIAQTALALAVIDRPHDRLESAREALDLLLAQARSAGCPKALDDQLAILRHVLVVQNKYTGDENHHDDARATNLADVLERRRGSPVALGILYLHIAGKMGWAMTGLDLSGHFLLRLSAQDGQVVIDPFRAGQTCLIEEAPLDDLENLLFDEPDPPALLDLSSELLRPLSRRAVLLRLQHSVKRRLLMQDRIEGAIGALQSMILFAPRQQDLWRELGYLQAERGHLRAAINALEVVRDLAPQAIAVPQEDSMLRELRWRLN